MPALRLVEWNMEWMNDLFVSGNGPAQFRPDNEKTLHVKSSTVKQRRDDLVGVITELNPDLVVVVEGPSRPEEFQLFFDAVQPGAWKTHLQVSPGQSQNIGIAIRVDTGKFKEPPFEYTDTSHDPRFDPFLIDTDNDGVMEQHQFERRPLLVKLLPAVGRPIQLLGLHLKSKGIFEAYEWSKWWDEADANRKKIIAQAAHVRGTFVEPFLTADATKSTPLLVCGDINDGPGMDASEKKLFGSGIERLMGSVWQPGLCLSNALYEGLTPAQQRDFDIYTTSYRDPIFNDTYLRDWIDHILYSQSGDSGHWVSNGQVHYKVSGQTPIWQKYPHASDHIPISVEL